MPDLAVFPKAFMDQLCVTGELSLRSWIDMAAELDVDGLEFYSGFLDLQDKKSWKKIRKSVDEKGLTIPMLCCSPDLTHPDPEFRKEQIALEKQWIDMTSALGGKYCRVLSGQRRPEVSQEDGLKYAVDSINACLPYAAKR